jgi:hypothetical protein
MRQWADEVDAALCVWTNFRKHYRECMRQVQQKRPEDQPNQRREMIDPDTIVLSPAVLNGAVASGGLTVFKDVMQRRARKVRW